MNSGDTFIISAPGASLDSHLWMVISDPDQSHFVVMVNFTTWRSDKDQSCVVEPNEHPYLRKRSCINYRGKCVPMQAILSLVDNGTVRTHQPLSNELLKKVRDGAGLSKEMDLGNWQMLVEQGVVE